MAKAVPKLETVRTIATLRRAVAAWRRRGLSVALVPTMGALHAGHLALVARARKLADRTIVSLFVNPAQFGPNEDFSRYPRDEAGDRAKLAKAGTDLLYAPEVAEIYPPGFSTSATAGAVADSLEGKFRPGHFTGVATVVAKLLIQAGADFACFGEKDYQQLQVITRMARDLDIPTEIVGVKTVREKDGLALSSRNAYLSAAERKIAPTLHRVLIEVGERVRKGATIVQAVGWGLFELNTAGFTNVDYLALCDAETLRPLEELDRPARILVAAWLGRTRLIDNEAISPASADKRRAGSGRSRRADSSR
jgi:pantoate--beta-alanine ligase